MTNTLVFIIISAIKRAAFHISSNIITKIDYLAIFLFILQLTLIADSVRQININKIAKQGDPANNYARKI